MFSEYYKTLEFDKILNKLASFSSIESNREYLLSLSCSKDEYAIRKELVLVSQFKKLIEEKGSLSINDISGINEMLDAVYKGKILKISDLILIGRLLSSVNAALSFFKTDYQFDELFEITSLLEKDDVLKNRIAVSVSDEGQFSDNASDKLYDIRRKILQTKEKIRNILQRYVQGDNKYLQDNIVTQRNGRFVIPVKSEYKNEVQGLVHDMSKTGSTYFIEPLSVVNANNELKTLYVEEETETERLLAEFTDIVYKKHYSLINDYNLLIRLDQLQSKAKLSIEMNAVLPEINTSHFINIVKGRHPLIDKHKVVPISLKLDPNNSIMIITGPNTGGKTVTLKTVGLFALMLQSGLHIPCEEGSSFCIFDNVFADLGDEQSVEMSLSTFSSHIKRIVRILDNYSPDSLILFDEIGSGTDPVEGSALAKAILEEIRESKALCISTTHYSDLKIYALETQGIINASCQFDIKTLKPTYKLIIGSPGKSNAIKISENLGIPKSVIDRSYEYLDSNQKNVENAIDNLENQRIDYEEKMRYLSEKEKDLEERIRKTDEIILSKEKEAQKQYDDLINKAKSVYDSTRSLNNYVLDELDKAKKSLSFEEYKNIKKQIKDNVNDFADNLNTEKDYVLPRDLVKGDKVKHLNLGVFGIVTGIPDNKGNITIKVGNSVVKAKVKDLMLAENENDDKFKKKPQTSVKKSLSGKFSLECDIRGCNSEEGSFIVDKYLDDCVLNNIKKVSVIHGKGTGQLRNTIWNMLKNDKRVKSFRSGQYGEGDFGVTVIELK